LWTKDISDLFDDIPSDPESELEMSSENNADDWLPDLPVSFPFPLESVKKLNKKF